MAARDIAEQVISVFNGRPARYSVNAPLIPAETLSLLAPFLGVASVLGKLASQLVEGQMKSIMIKYDGELAEYDTNSLKAAVLGGLLERVSEERVNLVNANIVATRRGLAVVPLPARRVPRGGAERRPPRGRGHGGASRGPVPAVSRLPGGSEHGDRRPVAEAAGIRGPRALPAGFPRRFRRRPNRHAARSGDVDHRPGRVPWEPRRSGC